MVSVTFAKNGSPLPNDAIPGFATTGLNNWIELVRNKVDQFGWKLLIASSHLRVEGKRDAQCQRQHGSYGAHKFPKRLTEI